MNEKKPRHVVSAEMLAMRSGLTGLDLLHQIQALALSPNYPTPDCFLPNEIWDYERTGSMPNGRLAHADQCVNCSALIAALSPDPALTEEVASSAVSRYKNPDDRTSAQEPRKRKGPFVAAIAAAAAILIGIASFSWHPRRTVSLTANQQAANNSASFASAVFVVTNEDNKAQLSIPVKALADGRLQEGSYPTAAAATALVSAEVLTTKNGSREILSLDPSTDHLRRLLVGALANACENSRSQQVDVEGLERRLRDARLTVQNISSSDDQLLIKYGADSVTLKPNEALSTTLEYCDVLSRYNGDTRALDHSVQNVDIKMAARIP